VNDEEEYLVGALGDAYVDYKRNELQFYQKEVDWLQTINGILERNFGVSGRIYKRDVFWLRKRNKALVSRIKQLLGEEIVEGQNFVAGLFDSEGSAYLASNKSTPVLDITQSEKGLKKLETAKRVLEKIGFKCFLNGPYRNKHGKLAQYHLRLYGVANTKEFLERIPLKHSVKKKQIIFILGGEIRAPNSDSLKVN